MNRWSFTDTARGALWYLLLVVVVPLTSLVILGLVHLWQAGQMIQLLLSWLIITGLGYGVLIVWPDRRAQRAAAVAEARAKAENLSDTDTPDDTLPDQLNPKADWSARDRDIWQHSCQWIEQELNSSLDWPEIPERSMEQLARIAAHYHGDSASSRWRFTLPEALLVISVASDRYRTLVMSHVPFAERISVSSLVTIYDRQAQVQTGITWFNRARRTVRLLNPVAAVIGELRDQITNRVLDRASLSLQNDLKRLLLQEIAQVGIDLYSGRLKVSDAELAEFRSSASVADQTRGADAIEPLRIVLLGQVSAGKSSLVNALIDTLAAEVDLLPTTDRTTVHALTSEEGLPLVLVDTPGIDGDASRRQELVATASEADLIIWACRATQPARAPDTELLAQINRWFDDRPERRRPPRVLALTQVDQLKPRKLWAPPYPMQSDDPKAVTIRAALNSVRDTVGFSEQTPAIPVCASNEREHYNVDTIAAQIMLQAENATLTQMNRRRVEGSSGGTSWKQRLNQASNLGLAIGKRVVRR